MPDANTSAQLSGRLNYRTRNAVIEDITKSTLDAMSASDLQDAKYVENAILNSVNLQISLENKSRKGNGITQLQYLVELTPTQIAVILLRVYPIVKIAAAGMGSDEDQDLIAFYADEGENKGLYVSSDTQFRKIVRRYNYNIQSRQIEEVLNVLKERLPRVTVCNKQNLIAVNNGVFDYDSKTLLPFSPDYVFLSKSCVDYNSSAVNPVIHNDMDGTDWDVESWMNELSDDPEIVQLLWEILGAIIRPLVPWNKSAWFYSETGNNGKGTLCELMRQLVGAQACASISLSDFSKEFQLEPLLRSSAIVVDENDVGLFIDKAANLKAVITGDTITINRKFKNPIAFSFHGFMVQCLNEYPRIKDKSDSFFRRQIFVPFDKCFTGRERKYIKHNYLHRKDVLEYVLYKVLHTDYYQLSEPAACKIALDEYREFNDMTRRFVQEFFPKFRWDLVPYSFLYDLYKAWYKDNAGFEKNMKGKYTFLKEIKVLMDNIQTGWQPVDSPIPPQHFMDAAEPLIHEYNLEKWKNPGYRGTDVEQICHPYLSASYRGIRKNSAWVGEYELNESDSDDEDDNTDEKVDIQTNNDED